MRVQLRPYQEDAVAKTIAAAEAGVRRQLGVAATGLGKTIIFAALAERMAVRTLILAHRDELVTQAVEKVRQVWPTADVGVVKAERNQTNHDVVVASVQTLARERRLAQLIGGDGFWPRSRFGLIVVDEAHHAAAESYQRILDAFPEAVVLGVTATPDRGDGKGLDGQFDAITWQYDMLWGIRQGYLCDVRGMKVQAQALDLTGVRTRGGDYAEGQLGERLMDAGVPLLVARAWREHASDRRTLVFTPTVAVADAVAAEFVAMGVRAAMVSGETPLEQRRQILRDYSTGALQVVANCAVLTEGYDEPRTDCVVIARPTKSRALYTQMVGRGTRRHPDKGGLLVLDVVGASDTHSLLSVPSLFGDGSGRDWAQAIGDGASVLDALAAEDDRLLRLGAITAQDADLFRQVRTAVAWVQVSDPGALRVYRRSLGAGRPAVVLEQQVPGEDFYRCATEYDDRRAPVVRTLLVEGVPLEMAQGVGEDYVRASGAMALARSDAPWRDRAPSPAQVGLAKKLRITVPDGATMGQVSDLIDAAMARKKRR